MSNVMWIQSLWQIHIDNAVLISSDIHLTVLKDLNSFLGGRFDGFVIWEPNVWLYEMPRITSDKQNILVVM